MDIDTGIKRVTDEARKARDSKSNDWPGVPITTLPLILRDALHAAIARGLVRLVERTPTAPGKPAVLYVVPTETGDLS